MKSILNIQVDPNLYIVIQKQCAVHSVHIAEGGDKENKN